MGIVGWLEFGGCCGQRLLVWTGLFVGWFVCSLLLVIVGWCFDCLLFSVACV